MPPARAVLFGKIIEGGSCMTADGEFCKGTLEGERGTGNNKLGEMSD